MRYVVLSIIVFHFSSCRTYVSHSAIVANELTAEQCVDDKDGDGVSDCFDRCPKTRKGIAVNKHGCPKDTDGDGVADYLDKELITPTRCQPSDADGIGFCPDPECCNKPRGTVCCFFKPQYVGFSFLSYKITPESEKAIENFAKQMRFNPSCTVQIIGYGNYSYSQQQVAWSRVKEVKNLLVNKYGIDAGRFLLRYGLQGTDYLVELKGAGSLVASKYLINPAPPYPGLLDEKNKKVKKNSSIFKR